MSTLSDTPQDIVFSAKEVAPLLLGRKEGKQTLHSSLDLGRSTVKILLSSEGINLPDHRIVPWEVLEEIFSSPKQCFLIKNGTAQKIQVFSSETNWLRTLTPTSGIPTTVVAGFSMHRIKGIDPREDTRRKIETLFPLVGEMLDTATGLGYTTIALAKKATQVVSIEIDPAAIEIAKQNPWSVELFSAKNIEQIIGDASEIVQNFSSGRFSRILHDPPTMRLGGELYSQTFYQELFRILSPKGRLFHYLGSLETKKGKSLQKGVIKRLETVGFSRIVSHRNAFGIVAYK